MGIPSFLPAFPTRMVSTAGAGDAFLAGVITGLVADLSLTQAQELGSLVAALSVTSPHTINPELIADRYFRILPSSYLRFLIP